MSKTVVTACQRETMLCFSSHVPDSGNNVAESFAQDLSQNLQQFEQPLAFLDSKYKQDSVFDNHPSFVSPKSVNFGMRFETRCGKTKTVYDTFQYVSVQDTLNVLLQNEQYMSDLLQAKKQSHDSDVISHFTDGELAKSHPLFSQSYKFSLMIQLFYDGMGTTNPLRGQSVLCNIGVFYYVVKDLPDAWNTCFANVHLLAICYEHDLKVHGFGPILNRFCAEMETLSTVGFAGQFPLIGERTVYAGLCQVAGDNLALNSMMGFIESFSGDYFCTLCYATRDNVQTCFVEEKFEMRTKCAYDHDVPCVTDREQSARHVRGVKRYCELNNVVGYHVTNNYCIDVMHTLLEGVVPLEIGCVLYSLMTEKGLLTLHNLNERLIQFWGVINVDRQKKPPKISQISPPGHGLSPSMKATQWWALLKYLPLIIGDKVPEGDEHFELLLHLSEMVDLIFCTRFTPGMVSYMTTS